MIIIKNKAYENTEYLNKKCSSTKILLDSLTMLIPNKTNWIRKLIFITLAMPFSYIIVMQTNTMIIVKEILTIVLSTMLALTAIVFTGYAFFQALINDKLLVTLMSVDIKEEANLYNTNKYFAKLMVYQIVCLFFDLVLIIILMSMSDISLLMFTQNIREYVAFIGIILTLYINFEGIWEMKSFIFNIFQLFNLHSYSRLVIMKKEDENEI